MSEAPLLTVEGLVRHFDSGRERLFGGRRKIRAVNDVSFTVRAGETFALVGESGCGKSTTGKLVLGLDRPTAGDVRFDGQSVFGLRPEAWRALRRDMQMIFQDPYGTLDPRQQVAEQVGEPLEIHGIGDAGNRDAEVAAILERVGLSTAVRDRYPHELSGGQQQRVVIARALALQPKFIVCDEPVSALDVSIQAQVVNLLRALQDEMGLTYLFISHDLAIVRHISHRVAVMYLGELVEVADCEDLFAEPLHPYSQALVSAVPIPDPAVRRERIILKGDPPSPSAVPRGCAFHTRCPHAQAVCRETKPPLRPVADGNRLAACHFVDAAPAAAVADTAMEPAQ